MGKGYIARGCVRETHATSLKAQICALRRPPLNRRSRQQKIPVGGLAVSLSRVRHSA
jgi:hypothetical protein|eukprot:COSAG01_NODE_2063_length_8512_cov_7.924284_6_plen_57_part_00